MIFRKFFWIFYDILKFFFFVLDVGSSNLLSINKFFLKCFSLILNVFLDGSKRIEKKGRVRSRKRNERRNIVWVFE